MFLIGAVSTGQTATEGLFARRPALAPGDAATELALDTFRNPRYYDSRGEANELARSLTLSMLELRASYGLSAAFGVGVLATYRENRFCCAGGASLSDSGLSGIGAFLDWRPGAQAERSSAIRVGYEAQRRPNDSILPVADGQDRVFVNSDWPLLQRTSGGLVLRVDGELGRKFEIQKSFFRGSARIASDILIVRSSGLTLDAAATAGYLLASDARENGTIFRNRRSTRGIAGVELRVGLGARVRTGVFLGAERGFAYRNSLGGWRFGLTLRQLFGGS